MRCTMYYKRGDVILVAFAFTDGTGNKIRPVVVISTEKLIAQRGDLVVAAITANLKTIRYGDYTVQKWRKAGLAKPSKVTPVITTVNENLVLNRLGRMHSIDMDGCAAKLRDALGFD